MNKKELQQVFSKLEQEGSCSLETSCPLPTKNEISRFKNEIRMRGRLHFETEPAGTHPRTGDQLFILTVLLLR